MTDRASRSREDGFGRVADEAPWLDQPYGPRSLGATTDRELPASVQRQADEASTGLAPEAVHAAAEHGTSGDAGGLPYQDVIQRAFGRHDVGGVQAHVGGAAREGAAAMGAEAFASGEHVAFAAAPSLHTAAHEAAHVVQQRAGVHLKGGVGEAGDPLEQHADAVADRVVRGESVEALLDEQAPVWREAAPAGGPVQRKIRVATINGGEEFDSEVDYVQSTWGFTEEQKEVYRAWLKDDVDHSFETKQHLIKAIRAHKGSFGQMFLDLAKTWKLPPAWLEQILTEPEQTLGTFGVDTPSEVLTAINFGREEHEQLTLEELKSMKVVQLLDLMLRGGKITQSCGQTSGLIHSVLAPTSARNDARVGGDAEALHGAIVQTNQKSSSEGTHYYCHVEGGGHAFIVECFDGVATIYQSFISVSTLAKDLGRGKSYTIERFLQLLDNAVKPTGKDDEIPSEIGKARTELFLCGPSQFHPDDGFRTTIFKQEGGTQERLAEKTATTGEKWGKVLADPMSKHLKEETPVTEPEPGDSFDIQFGDARFDLYDEGYNAVSWSAIANGPCVVRYMGKFSLAATISKVDRDGRTCTITIDE